MRRAPNNLRNADSETWRLHPVAASAAAAIVLVSCLIQWLFRAFEWGMQGGASADIAWQFYLPIFGLPAVAVAGLIGLQGGARAGGTTALIAAAVMFLNVGLICLLATTIAERRDGFYPSWTDMHPRETGLAMIVIAAALVSLTIRKGWSTGLR
ncbi:MAG: hypothetical protein PSV23_14475 [Brevundimonas sp.]|uniref:hypothetical protein n=1 Tax=Brevundimonas sp. TaxID=1871086 RepID=UPI002486ED8B|nr:hypothetical protein [Brevundimonas sp.]MDI1327993.1 hypothetical protein [Brevundimonas sp.]